MANRAERRHDKRTVQKARFIDRTIRDGLEKAKRDAYQSINIIWAAVFITIQEEFNLSTDELMRIYRKISRYLIEVPTADELRRLCYEKTGLSPQEIVGRETEDDLDYIITEESESIWKRSIY